uniref:hypothetical protein n=1 Tax=Acetatifactor sp. TaxID=1872090 RepID=UPI004056D109
MSKQQEKKELSFGLNIGSSSILMIFVLLCLICFSALAIISAKADSNLSRKVLERTTAYYNACNEAETALAGLDNTLASVYASTSNAEEYFATVGHNKSYVIEISDLQSLHVTIKILYPEASDDTFYSITSWQVLAADDGTVIIE